MRIRRSHRSSISRAERRGHSGGTRETGDPGIDCAAPSAVRWIPGSCCARPGVTKEDRDYLGRLHQARRAKPQPAGWAKRSVPTGGLACTDVGRRITAPWSATIHISTAWTHDARSRGASRPGSASVMALSKPILFAKIIRTRFGAKKFCRYPPTRSVKQARQWQAICETGTMFRPPDSNPGVKRSGHQLA